MIKNYNNSLVKNDFCSEKSKALVKEGSFTKANLEAAFGNEAMAYVKYKAFEENARKQGYEEIAECYKKAAENELAHAILWLDETISESSINKNLQESIIMENQSKDYYTSFAVDAENEGLDKLKERFLLASAVENNHAEAFLNIYSRYKSDEMFVSLNECFWECGNCGYLHSGYSPPCKCPLCARGETTFIKQDME